MELFIVIFVTVGGIIAVGVLIAVLKRMPR